MSQLFPQICEIESEFARWNCSILTIEECTRSEIESCSHVTRRENIFLIFLFFFFSFSFLFFFSLFFAIASHRRDVIYEEQAYKIYLYRVFDREVARSEKWIFVEANRNFTFDRYDEQI